jgi:hypothetical protein
MISGGRMHLQVARHINDDAFRNDVIEAVMLCDLEMPVNDDSSNYERDY